MAQAVRIAYDKVTVDVSGSYALTIGDAGSSPEVQSLTFGVLTYPYTISIEGLADVTGTMNAAATSTTLLNLIYDAIDAGVAANPTKPSLLLNRWETIKKFTILENDLTIEAGELTPSMKLKRKVVADKYKDRLDAHYTG